jgi:ADP-ribose pyrophosphatase
MMADSDTRTVWECPYWRVDEQRFTAPDGRSRTWYTARRPDPNTVHMLGLTPEGNVPLLRQYRPPCNGWVWELPAGICDVAGESLEHPALRELEEEAGYRAAEIHHLLTATVSPGLTDEMYNAYLCLGLEKVSDGGGDGSERIEVCLVRFTELPATLLEYATRGELIDSKILTHYFLAVRKVADLGETAATAVNDA